VRIDKIELRNYRQYRQALFEFSSSRPLFVIVGKNGTGKTNLLNALTWCLYGRERFGGRQSNTKRPMPIVNIGPLDEGLPMGTTAVAVKVWLRAGSNKTTVISREQYFSIDADGEVRPEGVQEFTILEQHGSSGFDRIEDPEVWISRHLPERIRPYYMLNAERIEQFMKQDAEAKRVRDAILQIAQIDLLVRMNSRLETVKKELLSAATTGAHGVVPMLERQRAEAERQRDRKIEETGRLKETKDSLEQEILETQDRLGDIEEARSILDEFKEKSGRLPQAEREFDELHNELITIIASSAPAILGYQAVTQLSERIEDAWHRGEIPAPVSPDYLETLLANGECVCGRSLSPSSEGATAVQSVIAGHEEASSSALRLQRLSAPAASLRQRAADFSQVVRPYSRRMEALSAEISQLQDRLPVLRKEMDELGVSEVTFADIIRAWQTAQTEKERTSTELALARRELETIEGKISNLEQDISRELKRQDKRSERAAVADFAKQCHAAAVRAHDALIEEVREKVSDSLRQAFFQMIWKEDTFTNVFIDEEYNVKVSARGGWDAGAALGGGEDVSLALAFSKALGEVSGFDVPLIFDSPLVKLDPEVKVRVAGTIASNLERQVILLMKPDEFSDAVAHELVDNVSFDTYRVVFNEAEQMSTVEKEPA